MKIVGASGIVIDIPESVATGLIAGGHAKEVVDKPSRGGKPKPDGPEKD